MTKEEVQRVHDQFVKYNNALDDTPDAKLLEAYKACPGLMGYIRGSKGLFAAICKAYDIEPQFAY